MILSVIVPSAALSKPTPDTTAELLASPVDGTLKKMLGCFCKQIVGLIVLGQKVGLFGVL